MSRRCAGRRSQTCCFGRHYPGLFDDSPATRTDDEPTRLSSRRSSHVCYCICLVARISLLRVRPMSLIAYVSSSFLLATYSIACLSSHVTIACMLSYASRLMSLVLSTESQSQPYSCLIKESWLLVIVCISTFYRRLSTKWPHVSCLVSILSHLMSAMPSHGTYAS
jgi:hypothetical protein